MGKRFGAVFLALLLALMMYAVAFAAVPDAPVPKLGTVTATTITVSWPAVSTATGYRVEVGGTAKGTTANTAYTVTGLTPATEYTIQVYATNADGDSLTAGSITGTTLAGGSSVSDSMPASLELGVNTSDLFQGVGLVGKTFWPVIAIMAALGMGFWFLGKTRGIIGGRR